MMSSVMPFVFNAVELCVVTINEKSWVRAREVFRALEYDTKTSKAANIIKAHVSPEKFDIYINKEGMYELLFSSQKPKAKNFRRHCFIVLFPHVRQQLSDKSHAMEIEGLTSRVQALAITNEAHQQTIEDKDAALALLSDDLQNRGNQIKATQYENVTLKAQRDVYKEQFQKCQDIITHLRTRYVDHAKDPGKDNMIIEKNTAPEEDEFYEYPYYIARIQRRFINTKRRWFKAQYPHHRFIIEELDNANSIHAFNRFEEKGHIERFQCHFRLVDIPRDVFYAFATAAIQEGSR